MATALLDQEPTIHLNGHAKHPANDAISRAERSRINGAKSRGPVTEEGKAKSSQNARKHGLTAKLFLVDPADEQAYKEHRQGLVNALVPNNQAELLLVHSIAQVAWKLRQAENIETDLLRDNLEQGETLHAAFTFDSASVMAISLYQTRLERRLNKLFDQLRKMQKEDRDAGKGQDLSKALRNAIFKEKLKRGMIENDQTNPESEPEPPKNEPETAAATDEQEPVVPTASSRLIESAVKPAQSWAAAAETWAIPCKPHGG